ncbi:11212_t:CDS:2 [Racocetra fulgida]|uniref:11212_t:CDS:1 n=1 Tax=Racocetra fulgida TaxID=60492 RepID=A0A9N9FWM1_9GLOM|nr:11212_t:CDS:2 [Racocetra fulgida]
MIASISSKFSENNSTDVSDSSVIMQQNRQSPKQSRTHPDTSSDSGSQQGVRRSRRTSLREKQTNYTEATSSSSSESEVKLGVRRRRLSSHKSGEDSVSSSNSDLESRPIVKRVRSSRDSQSPKKSSSSSLSEISENYLSSAPDTESETQEPPSPPETPSLPLQKRHSSQSESSDDTSEDTDRTSEPPSPPGTPVPYDPCKICGGFDDPLDSQYPLLIAMEYPTVNQWEEAGAVTHVLMEEFAEQLNRPEGVNNAMKRTNGNNWVHVLCATFIPEISFYDAENVFLVMDIEDIRDERFELKSPKLDFPQQGLSQKLSPFRLKSEESQDDMKQSIFDDISQHEMVSRVFCRDHTDLPENFVKLNIRDSHSHQTRYTLTIPDHIRAAMNAQEAWYEQDTTDEEDEESIAHAVQSHAQSNGGLQSGLICQDLQDSLYETSVL